MPLAQELQKLLLQRSVLHADKSPIKQLTHKNKTIVEDAKTAFLSLIALAILTRYAQDGSLPIDNILVEHHIRPIAIGKKNWLFVGCPKAGQSMAAIYSLLMTAKPNGLEHYAWLKNVLERLPTQKNRRKPSYCRLTHSN